MPKKRETRVEDKGRNSENIKEKRMDKIPGKEVASVTEKEAKAVAVGMLVFIVLVAVVICILVASKAQRETHNEISQGVVPMPPKQEEIPIDVKALQSEALVANKTVGNMIFQNITLFQEQEETKLKMQVENVGNDTIDNQSVYFVFLNDKGEEISRTLVKLPNVAVGGKAMITFHTWIDIYHVPDMKVELVSGKGE